MARFLKRATIVLLALLCLVLLLFQFIQTSFVRTRVLSYARNYAYENYKIKIEAKSLDYRFFPLTIKVEDFRIYGGKNNDRIFLDTDFIQIDLPYSSFWGNDFVIQSLALHSPKVDPDNLPEPELRKGKGEGTFRIEQVVVSGGAFHYGQFQIRGLKLDAALETNTIQIKRLRAKVDELEISAFGTFRNFDNPEYKFRYDVKGDADSISRLFPEAPALSGPFHTSGEAQGQRDFYQLEGVLEANAISVEKSAPFAAQAEYKIDSQDKEKPYWLRIRWKDLPLEVARHFATDIPQIASSSTGTLEYSGTQNFWAGTGSWQSTLKPVTGPGFKLAGIIEGTLGNSAIQIADSNLAIASATLRMSGSLTRSSLHLSVHAAIPRPQEFSSLWEPLRSMPGSYQLDSVLQGPYENIRADGRLIGSAPDMKLQVNGSYSFGTKYLKANLQASGDAKAIDRFYPAGLRGNISIVADASGNILHPVLHAVVQGQNLKLKEQEIGRLDLQAESNGTILKATATLPDYSMILAGSYRFANQFYDLDARFESLQVDELPIRLPEHVEGLSGSLSGNLVASGYIPRWKQSKARATIQGRNVKWKGQEYGRLDLEAESDGAIVVATANLPDYSTTASGSYRIADKTYDLEAKFGNIQIEQLPVKLPENVEGLTGNVSGSLVASGNITQWKNSNATLLIEEASFSRDQLHATIEKGSTLSLQGQQLNAALRVLLPGGNLQVQGSLPIDTAKPGLSIRATGEADLKLLSLFTDQIAGSGVVSLDVTLAGSIAHPDYSGKLISEKFDVVVPAHSLQLTDGKIQAEFSGQQVTLQTTAVLNGAALEMHGTIPFTDRSGNIHLSVPSLPVSALTKATNVSGSFGLQVDAEGIGISPARWSGDLTLTPADLFVAGQMVESEPISIHMDMGSAQMKPVHWKAGDLLNFVASGNIDFKSRQISGKVEGKTDLVILSSFTDQVQAGGQMAMNIDISGNLTTPTFNGSLGLKDGTLRILDSPIFLERMQLAATLKTDKVSIETFNALMGGGKVTANGDIKITGKRPESVVLYVKAERVGMNYPQDLRSQLNADLNLSGDGKEYLLAGNVSVLRSIYREDIDPRGRLVNTLLSEKQALVPDTSGRSILKLDLQVHTVEDFQMKNNMGKLQAGADLRVTGNLMEPRLSGRIRARERSRIFFEGNELEVQRGIIDFYGTRRITPVLDVQLFTIAMDNNSKEQYEITLPLSGPVRKLDVKDPYSSPPLDPNQIYFLLLTGRVDAQLSRASSRFFQRQLASYVTGQVFSDVQRKIARTFGLSRVEIQPELVSSETTPGAKIILGKDFNSSLSLAYALSLTDSGEQTWIATYKLRRNLDVRFVDQDDGSYTANIRHKLRFGTGVTLGSLLRERPHLERQIIKTIQISNSSPLANDRLLSRIGVKAGDEFDFWKINDGIDRFKQDLQGIGYIFPSVTSEETTVAPESIQLKIHVVPGTRSDMIFAGSEVSKDQQNRYKTWWREGFSEEAVLEMISEDIRRDHWLKGFHQVSVKRRKESGDILHYVFSIDPGPIHGKPEIVFWGTRQYPTEILGKDLFPFYDSGAAMATDAIHNFRSFKKKVTALYVRKGFLETEVEAGTLDFKKDGSVQRNVLIEEGPVSRIAEIVSTNGGVFPAELQKELKINVGSVYDRQALIEDEMTIQEFYEKQGYRKFQMSSEIRKADGSADLILDYQMNTGGIARIASIQITGNHYTDRRLIEKRLTFKVGDVVTHEKLAGSQKNLYDLRIFHQASVQAKETEIPDRYDILVDMIEIKHYEMTYGLRYDSEKSVGGELQLSDLNLFGSGQSISLYTRVNRPNQLYRMVYHSPTLSGLKWKTLVSTSYEKGELTLRETNSLGLAEGKRYLFTYQRQRELWRPFLLLANYEFESLNTRLLSEPEAPFDSFKISRITGTVLADTRDDPLNAKKGRLLSFDFQYAPSFLWSDVGYEKNFSQYFQFRQIGKVLWASALRAGFSSALGPRLITERFLAGGSYTIRGFRKDQVGPKDALGNPIGGEAIFIVNEEARFPVIKWFGGAVFYDAGNVYNKVGNFNPLRLRHSAGIGLRLDSPFGVARFDVGWNLFPRDDEPRTVLHFGLGQAW